MKKVFGLISWAMIGTLVISAAAAEMLYVTQGKKNGQNGSVQKSSFANEKPFYIGAAFNYTVWEQVIDRPLLLSLGGNQKSSFDVMAGVRVLDWFRIEANYYKTDFEAVGDRVVIDGNTVFLNAIFDARLNHKYSFMKDQFFVPYVGIGMGISFNKLECDVPALNASMDRENPMVLGALAGIAIEFGDTFAFDIGYRYMYMTAPHLSLRVSVLDYDLDDLSPASHQFRFGARVNF